jgi:anti-sigma28 factor (negative regulator of flagellin synthesis)
MKLSTNLDQYTQKQKRQKQKQKQSYNERKKNSKAENKLQHGKNLIRNEKIETIGNAIFIFMCFSFFFFGGANLENKSSEV